MIGRRDRHGVDVAPAAQLAKVVVGGAAGVAVMPVDGILCLLALLPVDVANGNHAGIFLSQVGPHE